MKRRNLIFSIISDHFLDIIYIIADIKDKCPKYESTITKMIDLSWYCPNSQVYHFDDGALSIGHFISARLCYQ